MVGPISTEERERFALKMKLGLTALVAVSAALIAVQAGGGLPIIAMAAVAGAVVGWALIWFVFPGTGGRSPDGKRERF
ncbi:hypothetical protein [Halosegnis sp.]|uniref:hypothetical protein n=1 Tax=Halosegnis sp. TaxID=2864959 RepID=UPI0035D461A8